MEMEPQTVDLEVEVAITVILPVGTIAAEEVDIPEEAVVAVVVLMIQEGARGPTIPEATS